MKVGRALLIVAGLLVLISTVLPVWGMVMIAPQYPAGLVMNVYPGNIEGDLSIINVLNHYVGMRELHLEDFAIVQVLPYVFGLIGIGLLLAGMLSNRGIALAMVVLLLLTAVTGFVELQRNMVAYGTDLDPMAPLDLEPFVPPIIGRYTIWNFNLSNHFMAGTYLMVLASVLAVVGYMRLRQTPPEQTGKASDAKPSADKDRTRKTQLVGLFLMAALLLSSGTGAMAAQAASAPPGDRVEKGGVEQATSVPVPIDDAGGAPSTITVSPNSSPTLTEALAVVADGGTVRVTPGVYSGPIVVERGVTVIADSHPGVADRGASALFDRAVGNERPPDDTRGPETTFRGEPVEIVGEGEVVLLKDGSNLVGVHVRHVGTLIRSDEAAVRVWDYGSAVIDNTLMFDTAHGLYVERGGQHIIRNNAVVGLDLQNYIDDRGNGIYLFDTEDNVVENNRVELARDAVYLQFAGGDVIVGNDITKSRYGIHSMFSSDIIYDSNRLFQNVIGSAFMYSHNMDVTNNLIADHTDHRGYGILLKSAHRNRLSDNYLVGNHTGLFFDLSDENVIERNIFAVNNMGVSLFSSSNRNRIVNNSFIGNLADTSLHVGRHSTIWATEETGGNYWDTYRGVDVDGDGFGALPHTSAEPFAHLTRYNRELHAFYLSPAVDVLSWAERAFPLFQAPRAVDERPLVQPDPRAVDALRRQLQATIGNEHLQRHGRDASGGGRAAHLGVSSGLLVIGLSLIIVLSSFRNSGMTATER